MRKMLLRKVTSRKATRVENLAAAHVLAHRQKTRARQSDARARLQQRILKKRASAATTTLAPVLQVAGGAHKVTEKREADKEQETDNGSGAKKSAETVKQTPALVAAKDDERANERTKDANAADTADERPRQSAVVGLPTPPVAVVPVLSDASSVLPPPKKKKQKTTKTGTNKSRTKKAQKKKRRKQQQQQQKKKKQQGTGPRERE